MELLHKGFDALDVSYAVHFPEKFMPILHQAKQKAGEIKAPVMVSLDGVGFNVSSGGMQGGYAFWCSTGSAGENWGIKMPNTKDPWGVRVSVSAIQTALLGLGGVKERLESKFERLGIPLRQGQESISRVDFALDFIMPNFDLVTDNFVMHPRFGWKRHVPITEYKEAGRTGRTQSVTVGKNPGRQIIVYDKRAEVLAKGKSHWPLVWNKSREKQGLPALDLSDGENSQVWRVELRAYKRHLKEDWGVTTWSQLEKKLPEIFNGLLSDIRYTRPTLDATRSRWPEHELWARVRKELQDDLSKMKSFATESAIAEVLKAEREQMLMAQIVGCALSLAASRNIEFVGLSSFARTLGGEIKELFRDNPAKTERKFAQAKGKIT
tara:strand:+ start:2845 stop:3984 length:1140 start_codon:yes stop_codon:yes gene_type:complete